MKTKILILTLLLIGFKTLNAQQQWTGPVQISTLTGINRYPDFCIDNNGTIHCVWSYKVESNYWHIYYSKSTDDGQTWSEPENVSQNTSMWMENPHIVADSENNLHLTYDYNTGDPYHTLIVHRKFSGNSWSDEDTVSTGWFGARYNRLLIDHDDKIYCFWFHDIQNGTEFYRILENGLWGEIMKVYNNNDSYYLEKAVVDSINKIHCSGYRYFEGQTSYEQRIVYSTYFNNTWSELTQISFDYDALSGNDIALDSNNNPQIIWRQVINDSIPPEDGTIFSKFDGNEWTNPKIIDKDASDQAIAIDKNNKTHIIENKTFEYGYRLIHYQFINNGWVGNIIEEDMYGNYGNKIISRGNYLYLISAKAYNTYPNSDIQIVLRKYEITTRTSENNILSLSLNVYPNPSCGKTNITYTLQKEYQVKIKIYDIQGKVIKTIMEKKQAPGNYKIIWKGTSKNGKEVNSGTYLISLQAGRQIMTRLVEVIK